MLMSTPFYLLCPRPLPPRSQPITRRSVLRALSLGASPSPADLARTLVLAPSPRHVRRAARCAAALARAGRIPLEWLN